MGNTKYIESTKDKEESLFSVRFVCFVVEILAARRR